MKSSGRMKVLALLFTPTLWLFSISKKRLFLNTCILQAGICMCYLSTGQGPAVSHCNHSDRPTQSCQKPAQAKKPGREQSMASQPQDQRAKAARSAHQSLLHAAKASGFGVLSNTRGQKRHLAEKQRARKDNM